MRNSLSARVLCGILCAAVITAGPGDTASAQSLPSPWTAQDVGAPALQGSTVHSNDSFIVRAAGADIWNASDQFHFVYQPVTGDVEIVARVASVFRTHVWARGGVMVRESLGSESRHAFVSLSAMKGYAFQRRPEPGGLTAHTAGGNGVAPGWVKLVRTGDLFEAYRSMDGATWTKIGSDTVPMNRTVYVGLAATSRMTSKMTAVTFDQVNVTATASTNNPPAVSIMAPVSGTTLTAPASVTIEASAMDPENRLASVDFYADGTLIGRDTGAPYSMPWSASAAATYRLTAIAHDADGGSTTSSPVTITVQSATNNPPVVALSTNVVSAMIAPATIPLSATASDPEGQLARVEFFNGATRLGTDTTAPYTFSWSNVAAGTYSLTAVAFDAQGASATSNVITVTVQTANQNPTVSLATSGTSFTAPATIALTASATDPEGRMARVEFYNGTSLLANDTASPYSFSWSNVAAGSYTVRAVAYDADGGSASSNTVTVTVQPANQPPAVSLSTNGLSFIAPASVTLSAAASDPEGQLARVEFFAGTVRLGTATAAPYTLTWSNVQAGTYALTAVAFDAAGASATSAPVTISVAAQTIAPPTGVAFTASADHETNVTSYVLKVFTAGANTSTATPVATSDLGKPAPAANGDITVDRAAFFSALATGNYVATVTAVGPGGQTQSASVSFTR